MAKLPKLSTQIDNAVKVEPLVKQALENIKATIVANMSVKNRNASGDTVRSLRIETTGIGGSLYGKRSMIALETGRKGGKIPHGFVDILVQWIKDKGISVNNSGNTEEERIRKAAYIMSRRIAKDGTSLYRRGIFQDIFSQAIDNAVSSLNDKIGTQISSHVRYLNEKFAEKDK